MGMDVSGWMIWQSEPVDELKGGAEDLVPLSAVSEGLDHRGDIESPGALPHQRHVERGVAGVQLVERPEAKLALGGGHGVGLSLGLCDRLRLRRVLFVPFLFDGNLQQLTLTKDGWVRHPV